MIINICDKCNGIKEGSYVQTINEILFICSDCEMKFINNYYSPIEWHSGTKEWWAESKGHRKDGPAVECTDGTKEWWFKDKYQIARQSLVHQILTHHQKKTKNQ